MRLVPTLSFLSDRGGGVRNLSDCGWGGGSLSSRSWGGCGNLSNRGRRVEGLRDRGNGVRAQREYHDRDADDNGHAAGHDDLARCLGVHIEILSWFSECVGSARSMTAVGRACQLAHAVRGRSTQQTVTPEDQRYASKSWLVGSLAHLVAPIVKRWAGRLTTGMTRKVRRRICTASSAASASLVVDDTHSLIAYGLTRLSHGCSLHP